MLQVTDLIIHDKCNVMAVQDDRDSDDFSDISMHLTRSPVSRALPSAEGTELMEAKNMLEERLREQPGVAMGVRHQTGENYRGIKVERHGDVIVGYAKTMGVDVELGEYVSGEWKIVGEIDYRLVGNR